MGTIEIELNTLPPPAKASLGPRVKAYKDEIKKLKKIFVRNLPALSSLIGEYACLSIDVLGHREIVNSHRAGPAPRRKSGDSR